MRWFVGLGLGLLLSSAGAQNEPMSMPVQPVGSVSTPDKAAESAPIYQAASTRRMAERLRAIYDATDWRADPNKAAERVRYYTGMLSSQHLELRSDTTGAVVNSTVFRVQ